MLLSGMHGQAGCVSPQCRHVSQMDGKPSCVVHIVVGEYGWNQSNQYYYRSKLASLNNQVSEEGFPVPSTTQGTIIEIGDFVVCDYHVHQASKLFASS